MVFQDRILRQKFESLPSFILIFNLKKLEQTNEYYFSKLNLKVLSSKKKEAICLSFSQTSAPLGFGVYMIFVSFNKTSLLSSGVFLSEPTSNWRKTNKGGICVEKEAEAKLNLLHIKNNLQQEIKIVVFIL